MRRRRFRGKRRYYRSLKARAARFTLDTSTDGWFDLWHTHFDWHGHGARGLTHRRLHLSALFLAFERVVEQCQDPGAPIQVFVSIAPDAEAEQDALYAHTANPNGTPFPYAFDGYVWGIDPPPLLAPYVQGRRWQVGVRRADDGREWFAVRPREKPLRG